MSDTPIVAAELPSAAGNIGHITLDAPATLNSLTLDMVDMLAEQLAAWRDDDAIAAVMIDGAGDKAFCAGGDVQALYRSATGTPGGPCEYAETFFAREYRMNHALHSYPKPLLCWGHGIVMGGGLGVMAACSHRIVTEKTRIAMPEISIALFPDVGGTWFLNRMPGKAGLFLALTGASVNSADALYCGIADEFIASDHRADVFAALQQQEWTRSSADNRERMGALLQRYAQRSEAGQPEGQVEPHQATIDALCDGDDIHRIIDNILNLQTSDPWLEKAQQNLAAGSKLAALWIHRQLVQHRHASLKEVFQSEVQLATNIVRHPEFAEGVRALLIDKDRTPAWQYDESRAVPPQLLDSLFRAPWERNPLADL